MTPSPPTPSSLSRKDLATRLVHLITAVVVYIASSTLVEPDQHVLQTVLAINVGALARLVVEGLIYHQQLSKMLWLRSLVVWQCRFMLIGAALLLLSSGSALLQQQFVLGGVWTVLLSLITALLAGSFLSRDSTNPIFQRVDRVTCSNCGQQNIPERRTCKRCGVALAT